VRLDVTLVEYHDRIVAHRPDCPVVTVARELGLPLATLFGCRALPSPDTAERHDCLEART
jgi:hypothetical protein